MGEFVFDPRVFILPPFRSCPNCPRADTYGALMIGGVRYTRRCRECWHTDHYTLPPLEKKVMYLDQMVISHMTKALHPTAAAGREIDPFWHGKPLTGDVVWSVPTLVTLNPLGAPIAHAGLHVSAVLHSYDTDTFLPPHR